MEESKMNSPTPMYLSAKFRTPSDDIRSRSGLCSGGDEGGDKEIRIGCKFLHHIKLLFKAHDSPDDRFTPASRVEKRMRSAE
jgi:hypothetical protein